MMYTTVAGEVIPLELLLSPGVSKGISIVVQL